MKIFWITASVYIFFAPSCGAQQTTLPPIATIEFAKPNLVQDVDSKPYIVGRFECSQDGSIDTLLVGYAANDRQGSGDRAALIAVHPDGSVSNFPWHAVPGYSSISELGSIFVGYEHVYMLVRGRHQTDSQAGIKPDYLVLVFDTTGRLVKQLVLDRARKPLIIGAFGSGDIVVASEDQLNNRVVLSIVSSDGKPVRELLLGTADYIARAAKTAVNGRFSPNLVISSSKFYPMGGHIILAPLGFSDLPLVELDEQGVVNSAVPHLPADNMVVQSVLSANHETVKLQVATTINEDAVNLSDNRGKTLGFATKPSGVIAEVSTKDGSLVRQIDIPNMPVLPACETDGTYRFLSSGGQGGLQVVTGHLESH